MFIKASHEPSNTLLILANHKVEFFVSMLADLGLDRQLSDEFDSNNPSSHMYSVKNDSQYTSKSEIYTASKSLLSAGHYGWTCPNRTK
jgi:hypothetical protein